MVIAKKWVKAVEFEGEPNLSDLEMVEEELGELEDGQVLVVAEFLSVDPYQRAFALAAGKTMIGGQIARVIESKNSDYAEGAYLYGHFGWRTHFVFDPNKDQELLRPYLLPDFGDLPLSLALGALGMPGNTAFFGFLEICQPKAGETLVVTTAAGAVGSLVGQIGKLKGLRVVGITGSSDKCDWIINELGFDAAINYKTDNVEEKLKKAAPNGVDCFFDNVGGELSSIVISQMNDFGRISVCGSITVYNSNPMDWPKVTVLQPSFVFKQLKMEGFIVARWADRWMEGITEMYGWIKEGKIRFRETVTEGFENMPQAFIDMLRGQNIGKAIVKV